MRKPVLTIFYQFNPWRSSIGGIQSLIRAFIKYAPDDFELRLVGTTDGQSHSLGVWQEAELEGKKLQFMPLLALKNDDVRKRIPTTLKFTAALVGRYFESDFMHFHRLEPTLAAFRWQGDKTFFIHNDISQQMSVKGDKAAILWRRFPAAYFAIERLLVPQFTEILSCNSNSTSLYQQRYPAIADRVSYIKNSIDNDIFKPLSQEDQSKLKAQYTTRLGLPIDTQFVLFAGRLHPQKDPLLLVNSFAALDEPNAHLLIAGDGELASKVRSQIDQLGLTKRITMLGAVGQAELANLHRISSAFVLTSAYEGLPLVALESLACGTPVVTTRCGETPNLLTHESGVVCEDRTPVAIADALRKVLLNSTYYPPEACVQVAQPYSAHNVIQSVYDGMLKRWQP